MFKKLGEIVEILFTKHKFMRRFAMFWAMGTVSYCVYVVAKISFILIEQAKFTEAMFLAVAGLVATTVTLIGVQNALYQWDKTFSKDESNK